jgi:hypothetical protein
MTELPTPICQTCGTQYPPATDAPARCPICEDERQYVGDHGQLWTTPEEVASEHVNIWEAVEDGLWSIRTEPRFGIGQRAFLIETVDGNILWDCLSLLDSETIGEIERRGGLTAIAISHPHYYGAMVDFSRAFGDVPIYLHEDTRRWVMRPDDSIHYWSGESMPFAGGTELRRIGGHFEGFQVLNWPAGADGRGVLMAGDQPQVVPDRDWVSFMWSYPNYIPLSADEVRRVARSLEQLHYDRLYGAFQGSLVSREAGEVVRRSVERYLTAIAG